MKDPVTDAHFLPRELYDEDPDVTDAARCDIEGLAVHMGLPSETRP